MGALNHWEQGMGWDGLVGEIGGGEDDKENCGWNVKIKKKIVKDSFLSLTNLYLFAHKF